MPRSSRIAHCRFLSGFLAERSGSPVLDGQPRHSGQIAVGRDDRTVAQGQRNGGDHHIVLADGPADAPKFGGDSAVLECGCFSDRPKPPRSKRQVQPLQVAIAVRASFDAVGKLRQHRMRDPNPVAEGDFGMSKTGCVPLAIGWTFVQNQSRLKKSSASKAATPGLCWYFDSPPTANAEKSTAIV